MIQNLIVGLFFIAFLTNVSAQNLVPNGSFESFNKCPESYSDKYYISYVKGWDSPNLGTPDYFNSCSQISGVPRNWMGYTEAYDGNAYMGLIACMEQFDSKQISYREYIRIQLTDTLTKGETYYASMQVQLGISAIAACNGLGMYFTNSNMDAHHSINYNVEPQIAAKNIINDKEEWVRICGTFTALGNESFLIIGNFMSNQKMKYQKFDENLIQTSFINPMAYYYIDDVQIVIFDSTKHAACKTIQRETTFTYKGKIEIDKKMILENLYFEIDKAVILKESYRELDQLAYQLRKNPQYKLSIFGHTDNTGTETHNKKLSLDRARAVQNYLLEKGVSRFRITTQGFGSMEPIGDNNTDEGRQLNRRVEIKAEK